MVQLVRSLYHLVAVIVISLWALTAWPLPFPGIFTGVAALIFTVVLWAFFLSPKPVLRTDRFGQSLIELLLVGGAVAAMLGLGVTWLIAVPYFVLAAVIGYVAQQQA